MKVLCKTKFDCTYTGVTGHFRPAELPFQDQSGKVVNNQDDWNYSRNQQRNWETLMQIIGLRTQPVSITRPAYNNGAWEFEFASESESVFAHPGHEDNLISLKRDCEGVPMIINLTEKTVVGASLITHGADQNIWFESINNTLD